MKMCVRFCVGTMGKRAEKKSEGSDGVGVGMGVGVARTESKLAKMKKR
jgi:hypothetical protein